MGGTSSGQTATVQQSQSQPWAPAQPALQNILGGLNQIAPFQGQVTGQQNWSLNDLQRSADALPDYTQQGQGIVGDLLGGGPDRTGMVNNAYNTYQGGLQPYLSQDYLNPLNAPGLKDALNTVSNDAYNSIGGRFAAAGRDPSGSPGGQQAIARGVTQAAAPLLLGQYNQNVQTQRGAQDSLFGAGGTAAGLLSGLDQAKLGNQQAGMNAVGQLPSLNSGANATLQIEQLRKALPTANYADLVNLILPIAGLGGQVNSSGTQNTSYSPSFAQQFGQIAGGLGSLFKSDRRAKRDIEQVGTLFDGTPVYRFRYIESDAPHIGLMADEVEKYAPEAVHEFSGTKYVDYWTATNRAVGSA